MDWRATVIPAAPTLASLTCSDTRTRVGIAGARSAVREAIDRANVGWVDAMKRGDAAAIAEPYDEAGVFVTAI